jgi:anti-sigma28 factor (negative regulator of flagellin synthesis)
MSDTNRHITHRRPPVTAQRALGPIGEPTASAARVDALKKLVAAGQYHVSPQWLAMRIFRSAGVSTQ